MEVSVGPACRVVRIKHVEDPGATMHVEFPNGTVASITGTFDPEFRPGDVLLIDPDGNYLAAGTPDLWPAGTWVGIVRLVNETDTVVEVNGQLRLFPSPSQPTYEAGNTVEGADSQGVIRVLSLDSLRILDLPSIGDDVISGFMTDTSGIQEGFADFGGHAPVVARVRELVELPLNRHELLTRIGAKPQRGILFTGLPGSGKTMLARIIAATAGANFYEVRGPEVVSKWLGQSEELMRRLFEHAEKHAPAIIFFDEIDSIAGHRTDESHEASRRLVAQLLTLMDGFRAAANVIVIAATNRPQDIDVALRRPGRFDVEVDFPLPDLSDRREILIAATRRLAVGDGLRHEEIAAHTEGWSAAELANIWSEAALVAAMDDRARILDEDYLAGFERVGLQRGRGRSVSLLRQRE